MSLIEWVELLVREIERVAPNIEPQMLCLDIDGTITIDRRSFILDLDLAHALRELYSLGIKIVFASGNSLPVVKALARYLGVYTAVIAENGCIADYNDNVISLATRSAKEVLDEFKDVVDGLIESWQNPYRRFDVTFIGPREELEKRYTTIKDIIESRYPYLRVVFTGYGIHIAPRECSKGLALKKLAEIMGIDLANVVAVGDSVADRDMIEIVGLGVAVGDADEELKRVAKIVLPGRASQSTLLLVKALQRIVLSRSRGYK